MLNIEAEIVLTAIFHPTLRAEDMRTLLTFEHHCLYSVGRIWWENSVSNSQVRRELQGARV